MSACWPLQGMSPAQKAVLISLADNANDEGVCWPSIAKIGVRTCLSERAVRNALRWLEESGLLVSNQRSGRSTYYTICPGNFDPGTKCPPAPDAPLPGTACPPPRQEMPPTPASGAPRTIKEPSRNLQNEKQADAGAPAVPVPKKPAKFDGLAALIALGVSEQVARDWLEIRKAKKLPLTETALEGVKREAGKAGMSLPDAILAACEAGWGGFKASWVADKPSLPTTPLNLKKPCLFDPHDESTWGIDAKGAFNSALYIEHKRQAFLLLNGGAEIDMGAAEVIA